MPTLFKKILYLVLWLSAGIIRYPFQKENKKNKIEKNHISGLEKTLLFLVFLGMTIAPFIFIFTPLLNFANYDLPLWSELIGILCLLPSLWLFYRSHKDLGKNWSVSLEVREGHHIVVSGVYKLIRHPMYTAIWLWCFLQALFIQNYLAGLSGLFSFGLLYFLRVGREEKMMLNKF